MELFQREVLPGDGNYHSIPGNSPAPWHKKRRYLAGIIVLVLFAVIIIVIAFCAPSKEKSKFKNSFSASTPLEWIDDCPKSAPVCPPRSIPFEIRVDQVLEWLDLPLSERPSFLTLYISEVDSSAHEYGIHSQQVNESLSHVDKVIERLFSGLQQRNLTDCVNVFIVSDHGMADIDCSRSINLGKFVDLSCVRNTEGSVGRLQLTDCPNTTLEQVVKDIGCRNEHMRVYRKELLPVRAHYVHHPRIEPIFLDLDSGWTLLRREPQEGEDRCSGGSHGYDNIFPDMKAFFMALGPSMKKNFTAEPFLNIELYELMCELVAITPNPNNGTRGSLHPLLRNPMRPLQDEEEPQPPLKGVAKTHEPGAAHCPCQWVILFNVSTS
ncbi:hypothetical protein TNIN_121181 [Trichonephila inaurata madagascariensis]|uniref:Ectonucleotide pyrophosphatase/phosphodiesterase family member 3 n=1 Tax=Trichonephila inaurata madagascariensis TaxID=2747483 RepID=A0A8X6XQ05_9ARAC|nr:hypothetical protein TNIN_121181 [Trichonephila inaurata madagascariensis]